MSTVARLVRVSHAKSPRCGSRSAWVRAAERAGTISIAGATMARAPSRRSRVTSGVDWSAGLVTSTVRPRGERRSPRRPGPDRLTRSRPRRGCVRRPARSVPSPPWPQRPRGRAFGLGTEHRGAVRRRDHRGQRDRLHAHGRVGSERQRASTPEAPHQRPFGFERPVTVGVIEWGQGGDRVVVVVARLHGEVPCPARHHHRERQRASMLGASPVARASGLPPAPRRRPRPPRACAAASRRCPADPRPRVPGRRPAAVHAVARSTCR